MTHAGGGSRRGHVKARDQAHAWSVGNIYHVCDIYVTYMWYMHGVTHFYLRHDSLMQEAAEDGVLSKREIKRMEEASEKLEKMSFREMTNELIKESGIKPGMSLHSCIYLHTYTFMYIPTHIHTHIRTYVYEYSCHQKDVFSRIDPWTHKGLLHPVYTCVCIYVYTHLCVCISICV